MDVLIRLAKPEDAEAIARVDIDAKDAAYRPIMGDDLLADASIEGRAEDWRRRILQDPAVNPPDEVLVAEVAGVIEAYSSIGACRDEDARNAGEIFTLYVHPSRWREGVGGLLLVEAAHRLRTMGFAEVTLWVLEANQRARAFYESQGWSADGATQMSHYGYRQVRYRLDQANEARDR